MIATSTIIFLSLSLIIGCYIGYYYAMYKLYKAIRTTKDLSSTCLKQSEKLQQKMLSWYQIVEEAKENDKMLRGEINRLRKLVNKNN